MIRLLNHYSSADGPDWALLETNCWIVFNETVCGAAGSPQTSSLFRLFLDFSLKSRSAQLYQSLSWAEAASHVPPRNQTMVNYTTRRHAVSPAGFPRGVRFSVKISDSNIFWGLAIHELRSCTANILYISAHWIPFVQSECLVRTKTVVEFPPLVQADVPLWLTKVFLLHKHQFVHRKRSLKPPRVFSKRFTVYVCPWVSHAKHNQLDFVTHRWAKCHFQVLASKTWPYH